MNTVAAPAFLPWRDSGSRAFCTDGASFAQVLGLAASLRQLCRDRACQLCVATTDRELVAAAVLSACFGGPRVLLPNQLSDAALVELSDESPFSLALGSEPLTLPHGVRSITREQLAGVDAPALRASEQVDYPCVFLFTGGSTGRSRIWSKTAHNLFAETSYWIDRLGVGPEDCVIATVPPLHIYGLLFTVMVPFCGGASVGRRSVFFPQEVQHELQSHRASILVSVPVHYRALASTGIERHCLRFALSSGAPLESVDALSFHRATGISPLEIYGSTETGGIASRSQFEGNEPWTALSPARWTIVDERLHVDSPFLSPELPRCTGDWFATGDRAKALDNGGFQLLGRMDSIVKVGGIRVDMLDVQQRIASIPDVGDAIVFARATRGGRGQELIAIVETCLDEPSVRAQIRERLSSATMPRVIRCVEHLPLTALGKRDHAALEKLVAEVATVGRAESLASE